MTESGKIVAMDIGLHRLVEVKLEECRARWGECFELHCLQRNWGNVLDDRQVLRLARRIHDTGSIYGQKAAMTQ